MSDQNSTTFFASDEVFKERLHTCHNCPSFSMLGLCKHCGCIMLVKAKVASFSCPEGKWEAVEGEAAT